MNRDQMIRNSLLKSLDPTLYFQQNFFMAQGKHNRRDCDLATTKPSIILRRQSYLNSPDNQNQSPSPRKMGNSPKPPKQVKRNQKKFLSIVSSSQKTNTLRTSRQKYRRLGCSRRSQRRPLSKLEYTPYYENVSRRLNRANSCKVIGSKNSTYKSSIITPYPTSRDRIIIRQKIVPIQIKTTTNNKQQSKKYSQVNAQKIPNIPQLLIPKNNFVNQQKFHMVYTNNNTKLNPRFEQQMLFPSPSLIKSQSNQLLHKGCPPISFQYNNEVITQNGYHREALTSRTVSTPINMIQPTPKSERRNNFAIPPQHFQYSPQFYPQQIHPYQNSPIQMIQTFKNSVPNMMRNNENYTYAYPIYPVYRVVESCEITPRKNNIIQQKGINNDQLIDLSRQIVENDDRRKKAFDRIQRKLDQLSSRTNSLNKCNSSLHNNEHLTTNQTIKKGIISQNPDFLNEMNKNLNYDKKKIIDRLDAMIGKQNEKQSTIKNKPCGQVN